MTKKTIIFVVAAIMTVSSFASDFKIGVLNEQHQNLAVSGKYSEAVALYEQISQLPAADYQKSKGHIYWLIIRQMACKGHLGQFKSVEEAIAFGREQVNRFGLDEDHTKAVTLRAYGCTGGGWQAVLEQVRTLSAEDLKGDRVSDISAHAYTNAGVSLDDYEKAIQCGSNSKNWPLVLLAVTRSGNTPLKVKAGNALLDSGFISVKDYNTARRFVTAITSNVSAEDAPAVKAFLERANRTWSKYLMDDMDNWKQAITLIRTTLEAY